jgi:transposase
MTNNDKPENKEKYIDELERTIDQLKKELEIERNQKNELKRENDNLKKQLAQLQGSAPFLAASCKTAEAGEFPVQKHFTVGIGKMKTKKPKVANQGIKVMVGKGRLQIRRL